MRLLPTLRLGLAAGALLLAAPTLVMAQSKAIPAVNTDKSGLALKGFDPVSYFSAGAPTKGEAAITASHAGATYRFASTANRETFLASPDKYVPQFGGYCAMGVAYGGKYDIEPDAWRIVDGKLYLNKDQNTQKSWVKDIPKHLTKASGHWPRIRDEGFAK